MASTVFWPECVPIARTPTRVNKHCDFNLLIEWSVDLITIAITQPFALNRTAELLFCSLGNFSNDDGNGNVNVISKQIPVTLNLGEKMKISLQVLTSSVKPQIWPFQVVVLLTTAKKWAKMRHARAERAKLLFLATKYANY